MATPVARSGRNCQVRINSTILVAEEWTATPRGDDLDTTNAEGGGYTDQINGCEGLDVSIKGFWDSAQNPTDSPLALTRGATVSTVRIYLNGTSGPNWYMASAYVQACSNPNKVRGRVDFECTLQSKGTFSYPTGSI